MMKKVSILAFVLTAIFALKAQAQFTRDLAPGLRNNLDVVRLQEFLRAEGFFAYPESTGNYFTVTEGAVLRFQLTHGITPANGVFNALTRKKTNTLLSAQKPSPELFETELFMRDLFFGLRNDSDVVRLQETLRARGHFSHPESTGNYFSLTGEAVRSYQAQKRIVPADGSFTALTRAYLNQDILTATDLPDESTLADPLPKTATSTFYKKITIASFSGRSTDPNSETVVIRNRSRDESILVTGWYIETSKGSRITIPQTYDIPGLLDSPLRPITLPPSGKLTIAAGKQEKYPTFRENICTGYFNEQTKFKPAISKKCPRPDTNELLYLDDKCLNNLKKIASCTIPTQSQFFAQSSDCSTYMIGHLTYAGCVRDHRNDKKFYLDSWRVWLGRDTELFRNTHEIITLRDSTGLFVDERKY
ncbi:MAG: hypothetical protein G01um101429_369 [Parcubacteria group bacterium Gr01-1014_29]|nr:MAG: hypothetical protein G01um101429_369 [Parcubacteria group bacterium Gr01-1014_29]